MTQYDDLPTFQYLGLNYIIMWNYFQFVIQYELYKGVYTDDTQCFNAVIFKMCRR